MKRGKNTYSVGMSRSRGQFYSGYKILKNIVSSNHDMPNIFVVNYILFFIRKSVFGQCHLKLAFVYFFYVIILFISRYYNYYLHPLQFYINKFYVCKKKAVLSSVASIISGKLIVWLLLVILRS